MGLGLFGVLGGLSFFLKEGLVGSLARVFGILGSFWGFSGGALGLGGWLASSARKASAKAQRRP